MVPDIRGLSDSFDCKGKSTVYYDNCSSNDLISDSYDLSHHTSTVCRIVQE